MEPLLLQRNQLFFGNKILEGFKNIPKASAGDAQAHISGQHKTKAFEDTAASLTEHMFGKNISKVIQGLDGVAPNNHGKLMRMVDQVTPEGTKKKRHLPFILLLMEEVASQ